MKKNTSKVRLNLLSKPAFEIFGELGKITPEGVLGGGTAIMLLLAHRRSFDLDVFLTRPIPKNLLTRLKSYYQSRLSAVIGDTEEELSVIVSKKTKLSFIYFPFPPLYKTVSSQSISLFSREDLASNKAYVIGRRGLFRDYVDLFFLLKSGLPLAKVINDAQKRFGGTFGDKLFLEQLTYWEDLNDFTVEFIGKAYQRDQIQKYFEKQVRAYLESKVKTA